MTHNPPTFDQFVNSRVSCRLQMLINFGNHSAIQYAENLDDPDIEVIAYMAGKSHLFIDVVGNHDHYALTLENQEYEATNAEELREMEFVLYQWALDEGYFDDDDPCPQPKTKTKKAELQLTMADKVLVVYACELALSELHTKIATCPDVNEYKAEIEDLERQQREIYDLQQLVESYT